MNAYKVYESGSGKWVCIRDDGVKFSSNEDEATLFDPIHLMSAHGCFWEFSAYRKTMHAVPPKTNQYPFDCETVEKTVKEIIALDYKNERENP